ncbi:MAG: signal peptidase II [Lachnospiraceae bacterium]|nr:signal peptidase II [Lachnospiraceae bacterium]
MKKEQIFIIDIISALLLVILDQLSKIWAVAKLKDSDPRVIIDGVLQLYYLPNGNTGAAFGILSGHRLLFLFIALTVVTVIAFALVRIPVTSRFRLLRILLIFVAAGGAGNMIDRFRLGYVIDFIYFYLINFPIFNVADCYVTVATISIALLLLFKYKDDDIHELEQAFMRKSEAGKDE